MGGGGRNSGECLFLTITDEDKEISIHKRDIKVSQLKHFGG